jgi:hypothetical protein
MNAFKLSFYCPDKGLRKRGPRLQYIRVELYQRKSGPVVVAQLLEVNFTRGGKQRYTV